MWWVQYRGVVVVLGVLLVLVLLGCASEADVATVTTVTVSEVVTLPPNVSVQTVAALLDDAAVVVIDVREDWEFAEAHIPGARWLPMAQVPSRLDEIPRDVPVILACRSDNRSGQVYQFLRQQGFENVHNMQGGMLAWTAAGYPVE